MCFCQDVHQLTHCNLIPTSFASNYGRIADIDVGHSLIPRVVVNLRGRVCKRKISVCEVLDATSTAASVTSGTFYFAVGSFVESFKIFSASVKGISGNSIMRDINERGEDNFAAVATDVIVAKRCIIPLIHSEWRFPRRWEILLNFHDTELDCFAAGSQVNLR